MTPEKYTITCKKCGEIRDITEQVNNELDLKLREAKQEFIKKLNELEGVHCVNMPEEFIAGSNWCNHLWENKIGTLKKSLGGKE